MHLASRDSKGTSKSEPVSEIERDIEENRQRAARW